MANWNDDELDLEVDQIASDQFGQNLIDRKRQMGEELEREFDALPQSNPSAINKQIQNSPEKYSRLMDEYNQLQQQRNKNIRNLAIVDAVSQIGQSVAAQHTPGFKPKSNMEFFERIANQPVEDYTARGRQKDLDIKLKRIEESRDPMSMASQKARLMAQQRGYPVDPNMSEEQVLQIMKMGDPAKERAQNQQYELGQQKIQEGQFSLRDLGESRDPRSNRSKFARMMAKRSGLEVTDDMSDWDIQNLLKLKKDAGVFKPQQSDYLSRDTGNPLVFQQETGQYVDAITGEKPSGVVRNVLSRDAMGNLNYMAGPGQAPIVGVSSKPAETDPGKLDQQYEQIKEAGQEFRADDRQLRAIQDEKKRLDKLTEGAKNQIGSANSVLNALDSNSKLSLSVVKARMPRVMGEVGNLNQTEQEMWQGSQAWLDRINQYLSTITESELTPSNKAELKQLLASFSQDAYDSYNKIRNNSAQGMAMYGVPPKYMNEVYGEIPVPKSVEKLINKEEMVRVREKTSGRTGSLPKSRADAAIQSGNFELVE